MNTLKCEICNLTFKNCHSISTHINKKHGLSPIFYYLKYIDNNDKCLICGEKTTFKSVEFGFRKYCSSKCGNKDVKIQDKIKKTKLEKYNDENYNKIFC